MAERAIKPNIENERFRELTESMRLRSKTWPLPKREALQLAFQDTEGLHWTKGQVVSEYLIRRGVIQTEIITQGKTRVRYGLNPEALVVVRALAEYLDSTGDLSANTGTRKWRRLDEFIQKTGFLTNA